MCSISFWEFFDRSRASNCTFPWKKIEGKLWKICLLRENEREREKHLKSSMKKKKGARRSSSNWYIKMSEFHIRSICSDFQPAVYLKIEYIKVRFSPGSKFSCFKLWWHSKIWMTCKNSCFNFLSLKSSTQPTVCFVDGINSNLILCFPRWVYFFLEDALAFFFVCDITYFPFLESFFFTLIYASDSVFVSFFRSLPPLLLSKQFGWYSWKEMTPNEFV